MLILEHIKSHLTLGLYSRHVRDLRLKILPHRELCMSLQSLPVLGFVAMLTCSLLSNFLDENRFRYSFSIMKIIYIYIYMMVFKHTHVHHEFPIAPRPPINIRTFQRGFRRGIKRTKCRQHILLSSVTNSKPSSPWSRWAAQLNNVEKGSCRSNPCSCPKSNDSQLKVFLLYIHPTLV